MLKQYFSHLTDKRTKTFLNLRPSSETIQANDSWLYIKRQFRVMPKFASSFFMFLNVLTHLRRHFRHICATFFLSPFGPQHDGKTRLWRQVNKQITCFLMKPADFPLYTHYSVIQSYKDILLLKRNFHPLNFRGAVRFELTWGDTSTS